MTFFRLKLQHLLPAACFTAAPALALGLTVGIAVIASGTQAAYAATPQNSPASRITAEVSSGQTTKLPGSLLPMVQASTPGERLSAGTKLPGMTLYFNRTQAQEADLQKLLAAQKNPSSPQYHQWLTPDQFAARFGLSDADIAKVRGWLEQQGFTVDYTARGRGMIRFSGSVGQAERAFSTELHSYTVGGVKHFAPSTTLSVPSAIAGVVQAVRNLDDFRPRSHLVLGNKTRAKSSQTAQVGPAGQPKPHFTGYDGYLFFTPGDIAAEYDISGGNTGSGQTIAIVGQSAIETSDIEAFQTTSGMAVKDPTQVLVPGSGISAVSAGDETESDIDLEWSGATAKGAEISFVYTGNSSNNGAFDAIVYAIDNKIGTIISSSYGECEPELGSFSLESYFMQAAAQGQTVISASGDDGSTDCFNGGTSPSEAVQEALAVDYPASSPYVTGVGGTEINQSNADYETPGDGYWTASNGNTDIITSVLKYIPEQVWNEDAAGCGFSDCLSAGGGGASTLFPKPSWQTGVTGIPADGKRDVPDISLNAATDNPGYLFCSSDTSAWDQQDGQTGSCVSGDGFRDQNGFVTVAGGTSFAAPIFAGMLAIVNQQQNYTAGQGPINPTLYSLAANSSTYASGFHDITVGDNDCRASGYCSGTIGFSATTGYDQASGLGSIDLYNLANAWPASTGTSLIGTTTTISAANTAPAIGANDTFTITVSSSTGSTIPTGDVTITVDSNTPVTGNALTSNGTFTYTTSFSTAGAHTVVVNYLGDSTYSPSTSSVTVNVPVISSGTGTFSLKGTNVSVVDGSSAASTITITPAGGYIGTVGLSFDTSNDNALGNLCYSFATTDGNVLVSNTNAVTTQLNFDTNAADCATNGAAQRTGTHLLHALHRTAGTTKTAGNSGSNGLKAAPVGIALAGLLLFGFAGRYAKRFRTLAGVVLLAAVGFALSACGGGNSDALSNPPKGTYTITLTGQDATSATVPTATTTFTLTIQ